MSTNVVELILRAKNETTKVFKAVEQQVTEVTASLDTMVKASSSNKKPTALNLIDAALTAVNSKLVTATKSLTTMGRMKLNGITSAIRTLGKETTKALESVEDLKAEYEAVEDLGSSIASSAAIPAAVGSAGAYAYAQFSLKVGELNTLLDGTLEKQKELESQALAISSAYGIDAVEVAEGYYNAVSSGATTAGEEMIFLDVAARTAVAGATDLGSAVDGLSNIMNGFNVPTEKAVDVSEALFTAMKAGKTTVGDLSRELAKSSGTAASLNISYEELLASAAAITTTGTPTSEAFTQISASMAELLTNDDIGEVFASAGYESAAMAIEILGLQGALDLVSQSVDGSTQAMYNLFGSQEAARAAITLTNTAAGTFNDIMLEMDTRAGALDSAYRTVAQTFGFTLNNALASAKNGFIALGDAISPVATVVLEFLSGMFDGLVMLNHEFPILTSVVASSVAVLVTLGVVGGTALLAIGGLGKGLTAVSAVLTAILPLLKGGLIPALAAVATTLTPIIVALGAIAGVSYFGTLIAESIEAAQAIDALRESSSDALTELQKYQKENPEVVAENIRNVRLLNDATSEQLDTAKELLEAKKEEIALGLKAIAYDATRHAAAKDRYEQLEVEQAFAEAGLTTIAEMERLRAADLAAMTAEQLNEERKNLSERLSALQELSAEAIKTNDPDLIRAVNSLYSEQRGILNAIALALHNVKTSQDGQVREVNYLTEAYRKSGDAAADFRNNATQALDLDFATAMDSLDTFQSGLDHAYDSGTMGANEYLRQTEVVLNNKIALEENHQRDLVSLWNVEYEARKAHIIRTEQDDEKAAQALRKLEQENERFIIDSYKSRYSSIEGLRDNSLASYRRHIAEVQRLEKSIADLALERETTVRDIQRTGLDDYAKYVDIQAELQDGLAKQQAATAQGQYDLAEQYYSRNMQLAQQLNSEVINNGKTVVSVEQGKQNAIEAVNAAMGIQEQSLRSQKAESENAAAAEKQRYDRLNTALENLNKILIALSTNSKVAIDFEVNDAETKAQLERIEAEAAQGVVVPLKTEVSDPDTNKAEQDIANATNQIDREYGELTITTSADTGEFEREVYRITDQEGYGAEVLVTMNDGQYYAEVATLENDQIVAKVAPQLVDGLMLDEFYASVRTSVEANPPTLPVGLDLNASSAKINEDLNNLVIEQLDATVQVGADISPAEDEINAYNAVVNATQTNSLHNIEVDNSPVEVANMENARDTSSTHTIYVREVEQRANGGVAGMGGFTRKRGFISGAGTSTSDSIPAMLSRGEFVTKASAVRKYGSGFMQMVNQGRLDDDLVRRLMTGNIPRFNTGGLVGLNKGGLAGMSSGNLPETNINFMFPTGERVTVQGSNSAAKQLISVLRENTRS